ncbi:membrane protein [Streptococcus criceti]|uniref:DUF2975 domain-containing protein n=1 Tax=Streptococcus criceti HS-6 TaxID=873449 RepID=G5JPY4_STRCG|nr:DUF2975 domain-containing protein [Streptococcus criceti]EHI74862.1 hypothetical protein STRCR_1719 [Streptococcus criceti HS-6]SUN43173.1 membrane protein [Streptococcus criceti]
MKINIFKWLRLILYLFQFLVVALTVLLMVGILGVIFSEENHQGIIFFDYGSSTITMSVIIPALVLTILLIMTVILSVILYYLRNLLLNFQFNKYFYQSNLKILKVVFKLGIIFTILQIGVHIILNSSNIDRISSFYTFTIKDYYINIIFLVINLIFIMIFQKGIALRQENEEII